MSQFFTFSVSAAKTSTDPLRSFWNMVLQQIPQGWSAWSKELIFIMIIGIIAVIFRISLQYILCQLRARALILKTRAPAWIFAIFDETVLKRFSRILPPLIIQFGIISSKHFLGDFWNIVQSLLTAYAILCVILVILALLDAVFIQQTKKDTASARQKLSLKSYIQLAKLVVIFAGAIVIVAEIVGSSPLLLLSGLGAASAVVMLVFKDTILSFTAGVQLASTDTLRVGDWIEMDQMGANGFVVDMSLHFVRVQNWDKSITTIPTWKLVTDSYRNWRGMQEANARRIQFNILVDVHSVQTLSVEALQRLKQKLFLPSESLTYTGQVTITNLSAYRLYVSYYLQQHPEIREDVWLYASIQEPTHLGIPLRVTAYTKSTELLAYERTKSDVFGHLVAMTAEFNLTIFQSPSGYDMRHFGEHITEARSSVL